MTSQKISEFNVSTSLNNSDLFTFVVNGTNKSIAFSDFQTALGVTGSISQAGDLLGTPVLDVVSPTEYKVRNIEPSKGILASVSAENGVNLACNFSQSATGIKLIPDLGAVQYKLKTIQGGEGISIDDDGETLTLNSTGVATPSNLRFIASESDFENQTASTITLTPGIFYQIGASFSTTKNFITQGATIEGLDSATTLTYTGTGTMFTNTNDIFRIKDIFISCASGTVFECIGDNSGNANHRINANNVVVTECVKFLTSTNAGAQVFSTIEVRDMTGPVGISFSGVLGVVYSFSSFGIFGLTSGAVAVDLGSSVSEEFEMSNFIASGDGASIALSGLVNSGNITSGNLGVVTGCNFADLSSPLSGISTSDIRWDFVGNAGLDDSLNDGLMWVQGSSTETVIATTGVPVKVNDVWTDEATSRFTFDSNGRLTYVGERPVRLPIDVTSAILAASGPDKQVTVAIAINGSVVSPTVKQGTASSSKAASITTLWQHTFNTNDYVEVFVTNETDTVNVIGQQLIMRIN